MPKSYKVYLDKLLLPITPEKLDLKTDRRNTTAVLINEGQINQLKEPGLQSISFSFVLPAQPYHFIEGKFRPQKVYLDWLEQAQKNKQVFQFIVYRHSSRHTNIKVSLENFSYSDDADEGMDVVVDIELKQYRPYGTQTVNRGLLKKARDRQTSPAPKKKAKHYTVVRGDYLWKISRRFYGRADWGTVRKIQNASNANGVRPRITNPNLIYPGQKLTIPPL